jgi:multidrug resistance protein, MATE family
MSQAFGAGEGARVGLVLQRGLVVAALASVPVMVAWYFVEPALLLFGQTPELSAQAGSYLRVQVWSVPCFIGFMTLRQYLQSRGLVRPALYVMIGVNGINALLDYALIFGAFGVPALGLYGAGVAAGLTRVAEVGLLALVIVRARLYEGAWQPWSRASFSAAGVLEILRLGLPIGAQWFIEVLAFGLTAMMAGWIDERAISAHTICLNVASLSFMLPLGLSIGAATRVGNLVGEGAHDAARRTAKLALTAIISIMAVVALLMVGTSGLLPRAYTDDAQVIALAAALLPVAAAFQIFDGTQVVSIGILRGLGRTRIPALSHFIGYYVLGLPVGYLLAFRADMGVTGLWWGLVVGLFTAAALLFTAVQVALRRPLGRVA